VAGVLRTSEPVRSLELRRGFGFHVWLAPKALELTSAFQQDWCR